MMADLIVIDILDFDIILGMDRLSSHYAPMDCHKTWIIFRIPRDTEFNFICSGAYTSPRIVSTIQIRRLLKKGCTAYLATMVDTRQ